VKRLMYLIPLSAIAVLVFAAIAAAQNVPASQEPNQNTSNVQNSTTVPSEAPAEGTTPAPNSTTTVEIRNNAFNPPQLTLLRVRKSRSSIRTMCRTLPPQTMDCSTQGS